MAESKVIYYATLDGQCLGVRLEKNVAFTTISGAIKATEKYFGDLEYGNEFTNVFEKLLNILLKKLTEQDGCSDHDYSQDCYYKFSFRFLEKNEEKFHILIKSIRNPERFFEVKVIPVKLKSE